MNQAESTLPELEQWLGFNELNRGHAISTSYNYRLVLRAFAAWLLTQGLTAERATPELLQRYAGEILHSRGMSPASRRMAVAALRGYYRWLNSRKVITGNPAIALPFPKMGRNLPLPIPPDDVSRLMAKVSLTTFRGIRDLAILSVLLGCGPRVSGVSNLNEEDLIWTKSDKGLEELTLFLKEKGANERYIPAPEETRLMIRAYLGHQALETFDRRTPDGGRVLFVNMNNRSVPAHERRGDALRLSTWGIFAMIRGYGAAAGVDEKVLHPHAFRHLYGQEMAEGETDLLVMKQLMGHANLKNTEIYTHIAFRRLREAAMKNNPMRRVKHPAAGLADRIKQSMGTR